MQRCSCSPHPLGLWGKQRNEPQQVPTDSAAGSNWLTMLASVRLIVGRPDVGTMTVNVATSGRIGPPAP